MEFQELTPMNVIGILFAAGTVLVTAGKFLISDWARKDKENIELRAKVFTNNFKQVEKDLDGLGSSLRSFKNEMHNHVKSWHMVEFKINEYTKKMEQYTEELKDFQKDFDARVREIVKQEIKMHTKKFEVVRDE